MKRRLIVEVEVDTNELFDMIYKMKGDASGITDRVVGLALTQDGSWRELIGLAVYGINVRSLTEVNGEATYELIEGQPRQLKDVSPEWLLGLKAIATKKRDLATIIAVNEEFWRRQDDPSYL